jgi:elongation factor G
MAKKKLSADEYVALLNGLEGACLRGPMGFPVVGLTVMITDVEKDQDSSPGSIQACGSTLVDSCLRSSHHILLEPIMLLEIDLPSQYVGDILSDLTVKKRGFVKDVTSNSSGERSMIYGHVPLSTMLGYATSVRSMTQGEGSFSLEFSHLANVDKELAKKDIQS